MYGSLEHHDLTLSLLFWKGLSGIWCLIALQNTDEDGVFQSKIGKHRSESLSGNSQIKDWHCVWKSWKEQMTTDITLNGKPWWTDRNDFRAREPLRTF